MMVPEVPEVTAVAEVADTAVVTAAGVAADMTAAIATEHDRAVTAHK
jgi:hypothetical protein